MVATFLTSIICAIYGMSPAEINFDSFSGGNTSPLGGSDTAEKLAQSKDSGLRPLLAYYENIFTDYILAELGDSYVPAGPVWTRTTKTSAMSSRS